MIKVELYLQFHLNDKKYFGNFSKGYRNLLGILFSWGFLNIIGIIWGLFGIIWGFRNIIGNSVVGYELLS